MFTIKIYDHNFVIASTFYDEENGKLSAFIFQEYPCELH